METGKRNVEIKASVAEIEALEKKSAVLSNSPGTIIDQEDTFFDVPNGRLKLRQLKGAPSQLIHYRRNDTSGPKLSDYSIAEIEDGEVMKTLLSRSIGVKGTVKKTRKLYIVGQTRVHVDRVDGLGDYMELEVVLEKDQTVEEGQNIAEDLMEKLGIQSEHLLTGAYMDMILQKNNETCETNGLDSGEPEAKKSKV